MSRTQILVSNLFLDRSRMRFDGIFYKASLNPWLGRSDMVYCPNCGFQNSDDASFCNKCGTSLKAPTMGPMMGPMMGPRHRDRDGCEDQCAGGRRGASIFWGIFVTLIGLGVLVWVFNQNNVDLPQWVKDLNIGLLLGVLVAIAIIVTGIAIIIRRNKPQP